MIKKNYQWILGLLITVLLTVGLFYLYVSTKSPFGPLLDMEFQKGIKTFDSKFTDHFPREIRSNKSSYSISEDISYSHPGIWLKINMDDDSLHNMVDYLTQNAIAKYSPFDTCLLIIDQHLTEKNQLNYNKENEPGRIVAIRDKPCQRNKYPIPNFWRGIFKETNETSVGLEKDYTLFVLESEKGMFMDKDKLPNGKYTPKGWEHGYSKGIAININTETIIYWFDIW